MDLWMDTPERFLAFVPVTITLQGQYLIYSWALSMLLGSLAISEETMVEKIN
jgi:hypothetical protein